MELRARIRPLSRRAVWMTALVALIASAAAGAAAPTAFAKKKKPKAPVITKIAPKSLAVGETLTIRGKYFKRGRNKNTVVFKRDGARAVFVKAQVGTAKMLQVKIPDSLQEFFSLDAGNPVPTRFRLRVLAAKFGKKFTSNKLSPVVSAPRPAQPTKPVASLPDGDCDGDGQLNKVDGDDDNDGLTDGVELSLSLDPCKADTDGDGVLDKWEFDCDRNGVLNRDEADDDKDLLPDTTETAIGTDPCSADTDGDGVEDGFEYQSAKDLNDDEYQNPNQIVFYPAKLPYPNPLFKDANIDFDGDTLTLSEEQRLWKYTYTVNHTSTRTLSPLSYSDGQQYSLSRYVSSTDFRRVPAQPWSTYAMQKSFLDWATAAGYLKVRISTGQTFTAPAGAINGLYDIRDRNLNGSLSATEIAPADYDGNGYVGDAERDEDADGLSNYVEAHGELASGFWSACYDKESPYLVKYAGTKFDDGDTDGDGIRDGADDQDHDDVPNLMEVSRIAASGYNDLEGSAPCKVRASLIQPRDVDGDGQPDKQILNHNTVYGRVQPFNPCMPFLDSRTCPRFVPIGEAAPAPFDLSPDYFSLQ